MTGRGRIAVAMSGGVDSSAAALLLRREGWEVCGVTLLLHPDAAAPDPTLAEFCAERDLPLVAVDARREFQERVIVPAAREYD
ncbi:MAG: tRNA 2-thiouridine(34) synthase MnmA, partial [Lentisphaeria bacterium]|nr:tRNA 2-thiouridine(34) synthase MnmA [Lentisphaeria bacterium]